MKQTKLDIWSKEIFRKTGFVPEKEIKRGVYYSKDNVRDLIFEGKYKGKSAILKIYDDPRITDEPLAQIRFNKQNKSKILRAAEVYGYEMKSPNKGWLIMEKLPLQNPFKRPLKSKQREELQVFLAHELMLQLDFFQINSQSLHIQSSCCTPGAFAAPSWFIRSVQVSTCHLILGQFRIS